MKRLLAFVPLVIAGTVLAAETGDRYTEAAGGFSYCPPKGWTMKELPGMKYQAAFGPTSGGFTPNINVVDEAFGGSLEDYFKGNVDALTKVFKKFKNLGKSDFKTDSGLKCIRLVTESEQQGMLLRQTFFFFDGKTNRKLVVTCSAPAEGGDKLDAAFGASLKTFSVPK